MFWPLKYTHTDLWGGMSFFQVYEKRVSYTVTGAAACIPEDRGGNVF